MEAKDTVNGIVSIYPWAISPLSADLLYRLGGSNALRLNMFGKEGYEKGKQEGIKEVVDRMELEMSTSKGFRCLTVGNWKQIRKELGV